MFKKIALVALIALSLASCKPASGPTAAAGSAEASGTTTTVAKPAKAPSKTDISYAFGSLLGESLRSTYVDMDYAAFTRGLRDAMEKKSKIDLNTANERVQNALQAAAAKKAESNLKKEATFLAKNKSKAGVVATASGLQYQVITEGSGPKPLETDTVKVHYVGTLVDGTEFDSSLARNEPVVFSLDGVIRGWTEGIQLMTVGSKYRFWIPAALAYGERSPSPIIEPNSTLVFEVELLSIEKPEEEIAPPLKK